MCTLAGVAALFDYANELQGAYMAINVRQRRDFERPVAFLRSPHGYCQRSSCPTEIPAKLLAGAASLIESVELARKNMLLSSKKDDALAIFECDGHPWFIRRFYGLRFSWPEIPPERGASCVGSPRDAPRPMAAV